jgi:hypothetical protein
LLPFFIGSVSKQAQKGGFDQKMSSGAVKCEKFPKTDPE